jgi:hypothetical protein
MFDFKFRLAALVAEIYGADENQLCKNTVKAILDCHWGNEHEKIIERSVSLFFPKHMRYFPCLEGYPHLMEITVTEAAERGSTECMEYIGDYPDCISAYITTAIKMGNEKIVAKSMEKDFVNADNVDEFINCAVEAEQTEIQAMLLNYKNEYIGFKGR